MSSVPRIGRVLDLGALLLFLVGGVVYVRAWIGLRDIAEFERPVDATPFAATELALELQRWERVGLVLMSAGVLGFFAAWWIARARRSAAPPPADGPA